MTTVLIIGIVAAYIVGAIIAGTIFVHLARRKLTSDPRASAIDARRLRGFGFYVTIFWPAIVLVSPLLLVMWIMERKIGLVTEELIQGVLALAGGRHELLGAERRPLVRNVSVGRQHLTAVDRHVPAGQRLAADREALPVGGGHGAAAEW